MKEILSDKELTYRLVKAVELEYSGVLEDNDIDFHDLILEYKDEYGEDRVNKIIMKQLEEQS